MADTIRLNKVLRELNISIDRVAEFLESKGHVIEKRPTTKIPTDLYNLLCDEFQIDADKKLASKEAVEAKNKEKEEIREKQEKEQNSVISNSNEVIKASSKVVKFKKVGKIDLEPKKEIKVEKVDSKPQKEPTNEVKEQLPSIPDESGDDSVKKDNYKKLTGLKSTGEKIDLNQFKKPIAAPSANESGYASATDSKHVIDSFGKRIDLVIDSGRTNYGVESTILDMTSVPYEVKRLGVIDHEEIEKRTGVNISLPNAIESNQSKPNSPGQLLKHYSTRTPIVGGFILEQPLVLLLNVESLSMWEMISKFVSLQEIIMSSWNSLLLVKVLTSKHFLF